jgi:hypothetical protein
MELECEFADGCPIVKYFGKQGWKVMLARYCHGAFIRCRRYQLKQAGQTVPDYVMPWDGEAEFSSQS